MAQTFTRSTAISVAVDPVALVTTECIALTSAMRKHARWAHSSVSAILGGGPSAQSKFSEPSIPPSPRAGPAGSKTGQNLGGETPLEGETGPAIRWGLRGKKGKSMQDNPLMSAFARLRNDLGGCQDVRTFDTPSLLHPFLQVIRSSSTSAPITSLALVAITKFFAYNLVSAESPRLPLAMQLLSSAITHCRFEASDSSADEIVLLRILKLMEGMISGPGGEMLGDESVCEMMETGLSMCCQIRLSELLRRSAEISMMSMCQVIFERLKHLEIEAEEEEGTLEEISKEDMDSVKMNPKSGNNVTSPEQLADRGRASLGAEKVADTPRPSSEDVRKSLPNGEAAPAEVVVPTNEILVAKPYSLPSIRELFRVLVDLLDPHDRQHTDTMRVMAMRILDVALEVAGPSITKHPSLSSLAKDHLCRFLFQLVRSDNMAILHESLRVAGTLLATCREVLKLQQELFLSYLVACLHPRVEIPRESGIDPALYEGVPQGPKLVNASPSQSSSGRSTPVPVKDRQKLGMEGGSRKPDAREAMVESVGALARIPSFMVELFVNYDCDIDRVDLCEDMIGLLSRNAFPDSATWSTTNVPPLCLEALLGFVQFIADRLDWVPLTEGHPDRDMLRKQRSIKQVIIKGAARFNESPKAGIAYLASNGIIEDPEDPRSITKFLKGTSRLNKKALGEYISKRGNEPLLEAFLDLFDFTDKRVDEALRELLESFRLPGEAPLIERIVSSFAEKYCAHSTPEGIENRDSVYVLTYAIIMLNTDQHNPNLKSQNRMSYTDFSKNLRGVNGGKDFAPEYLQDIFDSIKSNEIILPDEHDNKHAFDYAWKELLLKTSTAGSLIRCGTNVFDADMFAATWKPIVATLSYVFLSASDDAVFSRVVNGFDQCAQIAAHYGLTDALDHLIFSLSSISTLAGNETPNTSLNTEVQVHEDRVMVSELAVKFGRDFKAQLATVVLFRIVYGNEGLIRDGWRHIVRIWLNLFVNSLIPPFPTSSSGALETGPIPVSSPSQIIDRGQRANENGIFSAFTSYLSSYAADDPPEPSEEELESSLCTADCIKAASLNEIFSNVVDMPIDGVRALALALLAHLPEENSPVVIVVKPEVPAQPATNGQRATAKGVVYDPSVVYVLDIATRLALRDDLTLQAFGKDVAEALQSVMRDAKNVHPTVVSRAVFYLLNLLSVSHDYSLIRAPVVLHTISSFPPSIQEKTASYILRGLSLCIKDDGSLRNEMTNSPDFWSILAALRTVPEAASAVFEIVESVSATSSGAITADNFDTAVSLLNDFATAGSVGATAEQRQEQLTRRGKGGKASATKQPDDGIVRRGVTAISIVYSLTFRVQHLIAQSHLERIEAWQTYWLPLLHTLTTQCVNPCRAIRHQAFSSLQRSLLSPFLITPSSSSSSLTASSTSAPSHTTVKTTITLSSSSNTSPTPSAEWTQIFSSVLFPLILRLLKPEIYQSDPSGMADTRVQAATLVCKIFLHYLVPLSELSGNAAGMLTNTSPTNDDLNSDDQQTDDPMRQSALEICWLRILDIMDRLMGSGQGEQLEEAIPESLKNIILVMSDAGYLVPPKENPQRERLWNETWRRMERFLPGLKGEVFPHEDGGKKAGGKGRGDNEVEVEVNVDVKEQEQEQEGK